MTINKTKQAPYIQSLDRGLTILQTIALSRQPVSLGELAEVLKLDRSSAFRLALTLRRRGFLACPAGRKDYILGSAMWTLSHQYDWSNMMVRVAHQQLKHIANELNETAHLAIREGKNALFIDSAHANNIIAVSGQTGELVPLYCTAHGKALLADADEKDLRLQFGSGSLLRYTPTTIDTIKNLATACREIKRIGYATDEGEYNEGMRCVATPIRLADGSIIGSIGISAPDTRFLKQSYAQFAKKIAKAAEEIGTLVSPPDITH